MNRPSTSKTLYYHVVLVDPGKQVYRADVIPNLYSKILILQVEMERLQRKSSIEANVKKEDL